MAEKANIIVLGVKSGITNLNDIRRGYNSPSLFFVIISQLFLKHLSVSLS